MKIADMKYFNLPKIKPCPFCGGLSTLSKNSKTYIKGELTHITYCYCKDCDARGRRVILNEDGRTSGESYELAIAHWNRRVGV